MIFLLSCADPPIYCIDGSILGPEGCPELDTAVTDDTAPLLTAAEALADLAILLDRGIPEARTPGEIYGELMSHVDEDCPGQDGGIYALLEPCTTADGYTFTGVSSWESGVHEKDGRTEYIFSTYQTSMTASAPTGETLTVGGVLSFGLITSDAGVEANSWLSATVHYPPAEGWLSESTSSDMHIYLNPTKDGGEKLDLIGGYTIGSDAVYFDGLSMTDGCATGTLRARDDAGSWYVLTLSDCSGCGPVVVGEQALGEACIDLIPALSALRDILVSPP